VLTFSHLLQPRPSFFNSLSFEIRSRIPSWVFLSLCFDLGLLGNRTTQEARIRWVEGPPLSWVGTGGREREGKDKKKGRRQESDVQEDRKRVTRPTASSERRVCSFRSFVDRVRETSLLAMWRGEAIGVEGESVS